LLLEKAYAKIYGSYSAIEVGYIEQGFRDLTGAPSESFHADNIVNTWKKILAYKK